MDAVSSFPSSHAEWLTASIDTMSPRQMFPLIPLAHLTSQAGRRNSHHTVVR